MSSAPAETTLSEPPQPARAGARRLVAAPATWAAMAFVTGRVVAFVAAADSWGVRHQVKGAWRWDMMDLSILLHGRLAAVIDPWAAWDGFWYAGIARSGYSDPHSPAFFPAFPYLVRAVTVATRNTVAAGVLVSLVCAALAMVVLYRMVEARFGAHAAAWTVAFLSLSPMSLFFQAVYSESLFLLCILGSLALAERGRWVAACAVGALAALTRNTGVLLCLPLFFLYAERLHWTWRGAHLRWPRDLRLLWLGLIPAGLGLYMAYLWSQFGDPLRFVAVQRAWERYFATPPVTLWRGAATAGHVVRQIAAHWPLQASWMAPAGQGQWMIAQGLLPFLAVVAAIVVLVLAWRRLPAAYNVWALAVLVVPLFMPMRGIPLYSLPRFLLMAFPLFIGVALLTKRVPVLRWVVLAVSVVLLAWLSGSFALFSWVA